MLLAEQTGEVESTTGRKKQSSMAHTLRDRDTQTTAQGVLCHPNEI